jgi:hypothetical protein
VKPDINLIEIHPQLSHNKHSVDDAVMSAGSLWPDVSITEPNVELFWQLGVILSHESCPPWFGFGV